MFLLAVEKFLLVLVKKKEVNIQNDYANNDLCKQCQSRKHKKDNSSSDVL